MLGRRLQEAPGVEGTAMMTTALGAIRDRLDKNHLLAVPTLKKIKENSVLGGITTSDVMNPLMHDVLGVRDIGSIFGLPEMDVQALMEVIVPLYELLAEEPIFKLDMYRIMVEESLVHALMKMPEESLLNIIRIVKEVMDRVFGQRLGLSKLVSLSDDPNYTITLVSELRKHFEIKVASVIHPFKRKYHSFASGLFELVYLVENMVDLQENYFDMFAEELPVVKALKLLSLIEFVKGEPLGVRIEGDQSALEPGIALIDEIFRVNKSQAFFEKPIISLMPTYVDRLLDIFDGMAILAEEGYNFFTNEKVDMMTVRFVNGSMMALTQQVVEEYITVQEAAVKFIANLFHDEVVEKYWFEILTLPEMISESVAMMWGFADYDTIKLVVGEIKDQIDSSLDLYQRYTDLMGVSVLSLKEFVCMGTDECFDLIHPMMAKGGHFNHPPPPPPNSGGPMTTAPPMTTTVPPSTTAPPATNPPVDGRRLEEGTGIDGSESDRMAEKHRGERVYGTYTPRPGGEMPTRLSRGGRSRRGPYNYHGEGGVPYYRDGSHTHGDGSHSYRDGAHTHKDGSHSHPPRTTQAPSTEPVTQQSTTATGTGASTTAPPSTMGTGPSSATGTAGTVPPASTAQGSTVPPASTAQGSTVPPASTAQGTTVPPASTAQGSTEPPASTAQGSTVPPASTAQDTTPEVPPLPELETQ